MTRPHLATRREMLLASGVLFAWAYMPRLAQAEGRDPRFLVIVLRGALDGLATVVPVGDPNWVRLRGNDALLTSGETAALPLDNFFALNPAMPNLHRMYKANQATIVHAVASPYRERSHFDGQDVLESGLTKPGGDSGWLNRALAGLKPSDRVAGKDTFAVGPITPLIARGSAPVLSWTPSRLQPAGNDTLGRLLDLYRHTDPVLARALEERNALAAIASGGMDEPAPAQSPGDRCLPISPKLHPVRRALWLDRMARASARSPSMAGIRTPMKALRMAGCRFCSVRLTARWRPSRAAWVRRGRTRRLR